MAEPCVPGDGKLSLIATPFGRLSTSICFDADFPTHMQQASKLQTGLLLLPSGDWNAIAPYHSYMAGFRAIENGCSLVRPVSGGLSVAVDYRGKIVSRFDYFEPGEKLWLASVPVQHVATFYGHWGDWMVYVCGAVVFGFMMLFVARKPGDWR